MPPNMAFFSQSRDVRSNYPVGNGRSSALNVLCNARQSLLQEGYHQSFQSIRCVKSFRRSKLRLGWDGFIKFRRSLSVTPSPRDLASLSTTNTPEDLSNFLSGGPCKMNHFSSMRTDFKPETLFTSLMLSTPNLLHVLQNDGAKIFRPLTWGQRSQQP